jgi:hypothetical protein
MFIPDRIRIPDPDLDLDFLPIPDPGVKKAPDTGSGSATLATSAAFEMFRIRKYFLRFRNPEFWII